MKVNFKIIILFLFSFPFISYSQEIGNSLKKALETKNDSIISFTYNKIGFNTIFSDKPKALKIILEGKNISKKAGYNYGFIKLTNTHGIYFDVIGNKDSAFYYFEKSLNLSRKNNFKDLEGKCLNNLGMFYWNQVKLNKALKYFLQALKLEKDLKNRLTTANPLNNIGLIYQEMGLFNKAIEYHTKALNIRTEFIETRKIGHSLNNIGICYEELKEFKKAIKFYIKGIEYSKKTKDNINLTKLYDNLGQLYEKTNNYKKSFSYYQQSLNLSKKIKDDEKTLLITYSNLVSLSNKTNKLNQSLIFSNEGFSILKKNPQFLNYSEKLYLYASETNFRKGNFVKGREFAEKALQIKDSLFSIDNAKAIANLEIKYKTLEKEKEIAIQKEQLLKKEIALKNRNLYAILLTSALLILAIIFYSIHKKNQLKRKQLQKEIDLKEALSTIKTQNRLQEQRLRISRDLHDNIGSQLTFIISSVDNLKFVSKDANTKLKEKLSGISSFTSETIHQLRDTIWAMNKSEISIEDLQARILSFVEKAKVATENIEFEINQNIDSTISLTSIEGMNLFRVIQEAINNAIKYAEASTISVNLSKKENQFLVSIVDNGVGFDIKNVALGNGLSNIEKRVSEIDGKITIISKINEGTEILLSVNLKNTSNDL